MDIVILPKSEKPIYEQVYQQIAAQILNGGLAADTCLPSIRVIARELEISVITVKKAYEMLEQEGLIYTRAGKGCFVSEHAKNQLSAKKTALAAQRLKTDLEYYKNLGIEPAELVELIKREYEKAAAVPLPMNNEK